MPEHKFEPFDRVLVRDDEGDPWRCSLFSHESKYKYRFDCTGECPNHMIPYNDETAHLLGTSDPYEPPKPPKPPHEYKWGDRVEVKVDGEWMPAVFILDKALTILSEKMSSTMADCPVPDNFDPYGACANQSSEVCGKCFREWAVNRAMEELEASHD